MRSRPTFVAAAAVAMLAVVVLARAQEPAPSARARWEYTLLSWSEADTTLVLRRVTGDEFASLPSMLDEVSSVLQPFENPRVLTQVDRRLTERLGELGELGWEAFWVRDGRMVVGDYSVPAPSVLLRRPR